MADDQDVLVVGGGIVGLFAAYFLRRSGAGVTVAERATIGDEAAASYGNTGFVAHGGAPLASPGALARGRASWRRPDGQLAIPPVADRDRRAWLREFRRACVDDEFSRCRDALTEMKNRSLEILREMPAGVAERITADSGMIIAYKSPEAFEAARQAAPRAAERGAPIRVIDRDELRDLEPGVDFDISGAIYNEGTAYLHAPEIAVALAGALREMGVEIRERTEVVGFDRVGARVARVRTTSGDLRPHEVVIASGVWSAACARMLGLRLAITPVRGHSITVKTPHNAPGRPVLLSEGTVALRPLGDRLRFAGSLVLTGRRAAPPRRLDAMIRTVRDHLPHMEIAPERTVWTGFRPCTPDSLPLIGRAPGFDNVSVASGHGHVGMGLAPIGGRLLAQAVRGEPADMDLAPFRVGRFTADDRTIGDRTIGDREAGGSHE